MGALQEFTEIPKKYFKDPEERFKEFRRKRKLKEIRNNAKDEMYDLMDRLLEYMTKDAGK